MAEGGRIGRELARGFCGKVHKVSVQGRRACAYTAGWLRGVVCIAGHSLLGGCKCAMNAPRYLEIGMVVIRSRAQRRPCGVTWTWKGELDAGAPDMPCTTGGPACFYDVFVIDHRGQDRTGPTRSVAKVPLFLFVLFYDRYVRSEYLSV